ncbi:MAG: TonB-dependent receptor plug domain-containing protein, partial [Bacteroidales bacterium]|nr:TonB-dependent receptor plug domain-containing protein [Bacteroidales bacterium]
MFLLLLFIGIGNALAQRTITGKVTGIDGDAILGATVAIKGSTIGTISGMDGSYHLNIPANVNNDTIVFSYIGKLTVMEPINGRSTINVVMQDDDVAVEEVVVTSLGIKKDAKALGYAVQSVKSEELTRAASNDVSRALQGKVAGVDIKVSSGMPGASAQFVIRGSRSFTGNNAPLYVVDGMPIASGANSTGQSTEGTDYTNRSLDINPNDIESINVLKGQAAAALYGLRASNGVVVITTKSGKGGEKGKMIVTISENISFDKVARHPEYQNTYAQGSDGEYIPNTSMAWGPKITDLPDDPTYGGNTDNDYTKEGKHPGMYYVPQRAKAGLDPWVAPATYDNFSDYFRTGVSYNTNARISQATEQGNYAFSISNTTQDGIALNTGMKRW